MLAQAQASPALASADGTITPTPAARFTAPGPPSSPPSPVSPTSEEDDMDGLQSEEGPSTSSTSLDHPDSAKPTPSSDPPASAPAPRRASHLGGSLPASARPPDPTGADRVSSSQGTSQTAADAAINPLFALGEQVRSGAIDPSLVRFQKGGVIVRQGPPPRMSSSAHPPRSAEAEGTGWADWLHERVHTRRHQHGEALNGANEVGEAKVPVQHHHAPGICLDLPGNDADDMGEAQHVDDFRDRPDQQDHVDEARNKIREWKSDFRDRLEDKGLRAPSPWRRGEDGSSTHGRAVADLDPRLTAMLDRPPGDQPALDTNDGSRSEFSRAPSSTLGGQSSFYSAVSDTDGEASFAPARSDSPLSYASTLELHQPVASTSSAPLPHTHPLSNSADDLHVERLPAVLASGSPATNSPVLPLPHQPQQHGVVSQSTRTSLTSSPAQTHTIPAHGIVAPASDAGQSYLQLPPASPRTHQPPAQDISVPPPEALSQRLHPSSPSGLADRGPSPKIRRSQTTDSPPLGGAPLQPGVPLLGAAVSSRRFSSSGTAARLSPPTAQRARSFSVAPTYNPSSPTSLTSYSPNGTVVLDDVDASIAAQAEAIRRQRQEKRAEAEKEQARLAVTAMARSSSLAVPGAGLTPALAGPSGLKRRTSRMGSGGSEREAPGSTVNADGAIVDKSGTGPAAGHAYSGSHPGPGARQRSRGPGTHPDGDEVGGAAVLVGNLIGQDHANYVLMYNMLTGIRIGVSRCQAKAARPLTDADYTARHKFSFDIVGNELTPSVKYDFKFKDYAPWVFRELREYFYLDPSDYLMSLTSKYILSELGSPGKSGSFFYFSRDYRFIIKTIRHAEHKFLRSILKEYHEHVIRNPHTLLSRFYGLHRVKLPHGRKIHFVIMNNLFPPHRDIHETYDLKGSAIGRLYPEDRAAANPHAVLKDLNWVGRNRQFALGPEKKALFEEQLRRDTELLQRLGIMDYSLLTGIHNGVRGNSEGLREDKLSVFQPAKVKVSRKATQIKRDADASALRKAVQQSDPQAIGGRHELPEHDTSERRMFLFYQDEGGMRASGDANEDLGVIYYLGIIDILTPYTCVKRLEHFFKGIKHNKHMISAVPPREYGDRFLAFIKSSIRGNDPSSRPQMYEHEPEHKPEHKVEKADLSEKGVIAPQSEPAPSSSAITDPEKVRQEMAGHAVAPTAEASWLAPP